MRRSAIEAVGVVVLLGLVGAGLVRLRTTSAALEVARGKAQKLDAYCTAVRVELETARLHVRARDTLGTVVAQTTYDDVRSEHLIDGVWRCARAPVRRTAVESMHALCAPRGSACAIRDSSECRVDLACLESTLDALLKLLPPREAE